MTELEASSQPGHVHVWKVPLPLPERTVARLNECLNSEERERSERFRFEEDKRRYISARGALRTILGSYLNEPPRDLEFGYGNYGKPFLARLLAAPGINFNLSHCRDMVLIGVTSQGRIGIDVETIRMVPELDDIVVRHFSSEERDSIESADGQTKTRLFFHAWTRREAIVKARGLDLAAALSDLKIVFYPPGSGVRLKQEEEGVWSLQDLQFDLAHVGAVCVEGETGDAIIHDFDPLVG
jgi:4'-phosphopantetheinyl transferase